MSSRGPKLFNTYTYSDVQMSDPTLAPHINITKQISMPHTASRLNTKAFGKAKIPLIERFACYMMRNGRNCGKKSMALRAIESAFAIIYGVTNTNPIQILCDAIRNAGPREDSARAGRGGNLKRVSVDVSPRRRINIALFLLTKGIRESAFKNIKSFPETIADELIAAAKNSQSSYAVKKRDEIERVAKSNR